MPRSRPVRVVFSAACLTSAKCPASQAPKARASRAFSNTKAGALHGVIHDRGRHAAGLMQHLHPAVIARDQGALGRRQRNVELTLRVLPVNEQHPAMPIGTCATPVKCSMLPGRINGSNE
jgi:hypothetical protein